MAHYDELIYATPVQTMELSVPNAVTTEEHTGLSSSYYTVQVTEPTSAVLPYIAECNDIIESLDMTFAEANIFKAIWRMAAARKGKKKKGNNAVYDAEKVVFFANRVLKRAKKEAASG